MQKIIFIICLLIASSGMAQTERYKPCVTDSMNDIELHNNPGALLRRQQLADFTKQFVGVDQRVTTTPGILYTIPVVFHVMHNYGSENISKQQIQDALDVLNLTYQKLNPDTPDVIQLFQPVFANPQIQFRFANIDPDGNCTDGITRTATSLTNNAGTNVKFIHWDNSKYLNIWVVQHIASGAAGYAYYPGVPNDTIDGVEILSTYVIGPTGGNYQSRSLAHEVGHYLNLPHTWGSSNTPGLASNCSIDDGVFDTPNCIGSNPCCCDTNQSDCGPIANVQNYMDYASCHKMFTEGQKARMHAALNSSVQYRDNLSTNSNLLATGTEDGHVATLCVPKADFTDNPIYICEGSTVSFNDASWRGDATSWQWDFQGGTPAQAFTQNVSVQYNVPGTYDVRLIATNSAGSDTLVRSMLITVLPDTGTNTIPYTESFESISVPGNDWGIENMGATSAFTVTTAAAVTGTHSVRLQNSAAGNTNGNIDAIITPSYNFTNVTGAMLTYKYAFAAKNATDSSYFKVSISTNCGQNWTQRLLKSSSTLQTAPVNAGVFVPASTQWATQTINLATSQFSGKPSVRVRFEYWQDRGNNLYLDDINITGTVGINEILAEEYGFNIYPNPAHASATLEMELKENGAVKIELYDVLGKKITTITQNNFAVGKHHLEIPNKNYEGVYFVHVSIDDNTFIQKIVFVK